MKKVTKKKKVSKVMEKKIERKLGQVVEECDSLGAKASAQVVKTADVKVKPKGRPTRYGWLFESLTALKAGQSVVLTGPEGQSAKDFRNRMNIVVGRAVRNGLLEKAPGFLVQVTADDKVAISLRTK